MLKRLFVIGFATFTILSGTCFYLLERNWVDLSLLELYSSRKGSIVLDDEGVEFARFECDKRTPVTFKKIPHQQNTTFKVFAIYPMLKIHHAITKPFTTIIGYKIINTFIIHKLYLFSLIYLNNSSN